MNSKHGILGGVCWSLSLALLSACGGPTVAAQKKLRQDCNQSELLSSVKHEQSWVRAHAARSLGECRVQKARNTLEQLAISPQEKHFVRAAAVEGLGALRAGESWPVLEKLAAEGTLDAEVKLSLIKALCNYRQDFDRVAQLLSPLTKAEDLLVASSAKKELQSQCER